MLLEPTAALLVAPHTISAQVGAITERSEWREVADELDAQRKACGLGGSCVGGFGSEGLRRAGAHMRGHVSMHSMRPTLPSTSPLLAQMPPPHTTTSTTNPLPLLPGYGVHHRPRRACGHRRGAGPGAGGGHHRPDGGGAAVGVGSQGVGCGAVGVGAGCWVMRMTPAVMACRACCAGWIRQPLPGQAPAARHATFGQPVVTNTSCFLATRRRLGFNYAFDVNFSGAPPDLALPAPCISALLVPRACTHTCTV